MIAWYLLQYRGIAIYFSVNCIFFSHTVSSFQPQNTSLPKLHQAFSINQVWISALIVEFWSLLLVAAAIAFTGSGNYLSLLMSLFISFNVVAFWQRFIWPTFYSKLFCFPECSANFLQITVRLYFIEVFQNFALFFVWATSNT